MKRRVIIIGSPGRKEVNYLRGVEQDVLIYQEYLKSSLGGAWKEEEIVTFIDEKKDAIKQKILKFGDEWIDYLMIIYSGHGYTSLNGNTALLVNTEEYLMLKDLASDWIPRQLIIVDCCRTMMDENQLGFFIEQKVKSEETNTILWNAREKFDQAIKDSDYGLKIVYSTQSGYASKEDAQGGCFTNSLFQGVSNWNNSNKPQRILTIGGAVSRAKKILSRSDFIQIPEIKNSFKGLDFPFAVRSF